MPRKYTFPDREEVNRKARIHHKIRKLRGSACTHKCIDCGLWALDWSHIHGTNDEDVNNYEPRCRKCHAEYDGAGSKPCSPDCVCDRHFNSGRTKRLEQCNA